MVAFIKSHKNFLIIFLSVILSMAVAIACAFLITKSVKQISNEMSDYSYIAPQVQYRSQVMLPKP